MKSYDPYTAEGTLKTPHRDRPECGCNASLCPVLLPLFTGAVLISVALIFNEEDYFNLGDTMDSEYMFVTTSTLWIFLSFGCALMIGASWRIMQYIYCSNDGLQCVHRVPSSNIGAMVLLICLSILSVIGLLDLFTDIYDDSSSITIHYPWWLSAAMFLIAICCLLFVSCINTTEAATRRFKRNHLMNHYFDKMVAEEGTDCDFEKHRDKLPQYISRHSPPIHPYDRSTLSFLWHTFTHHHMFAVIRLGTTKVLQSYHCYYAPKADDIEYRFNEWTKENERQQTKHGKGNVNTWNILWHIEGRTFLSMTAIQAVASLPGLAVPQIIGELATVFEDETLSIEYGLYLTLAIFVIGVVRVGMTALVFSLACRVMARAKALLSYVIYYKAVHISINNDDRMTTGQKITLLAADSNMVAMALAFEPVFISNFVIMFLVIVFLHIELGISALAGWLFVLLVSFPIQSVVGNKVTTAWKAYISQSDHRVKFIDEIIKGIKVTKMYAWERALMDQILNYRQKEMEHLLVRIKFTSIMNMMNSATPPLMGLIMFGVYIALGNALTLRVVIATLALIGMFGWSIRIMPWAIMMAVGGYVAIKRLNTFCNAPDQTDMILDDGGEQYGDGGDQYVVDMKDATFKWPKLKTNDDDKKDEGNELAEAGKEEKEDMEGRTALNGRANGTSYGATSGGDAVTPNGVMHDVSLSSQNDAVFLLENINLRLERGKLYALVGSVGSGKSSLIQAILREMQQVSGSLLVNGCSGNTKECVGYVAQSAFIINNTVRANILWGLPYDEMYYKKCLRASSLLPDLKIWANGDLTEIGERGINCSGGQKQRISFCRALYRAKMTNLFLLDAPLSAVDAHVGNNIFHRGIEELLADKTVLMVMNSHLHLMQFMDEVIIMKEGKVVVQTTFDEVMQNEEYAHLLPDDEMKESEELDQQQVAAKDVDLAADDDAKDGVGGDMSLQDMAQSLVRQQSNISEYGAVIQDAQDQQGKLTTDEDRKKGSVTLRTYIQYFDNAVNPFNHSEVVNDQIPVKSTVTGTLWFVLEIFLLILMQTLVTGNDIWISFWAEEEEVDRFGGKSNGWWLGIWGVLVALLTVVSFASSYLFGWLSNKAAQSVHMKTLYCVLRAPMSYFDATPTGRILNRFSKDTNEMDTDLPGNFNGFAMNSLVVVGYLVTIMIALPVAIVVMLVFVPALYFLQRYFRMSSSDFKRLNQVTITPIISQFSETLGGLDTIRAFRATESIFLKDIRRKIRLNHKINLGEQLSTRWFATYLDLMVVMFLMIQCVLCLFLRDRFEAALLSLSVVYANNLMGMLQWAIRTSIDVEKNFTTIERLLFYENALKENAKKIQTEGQLDSDRDIEAQKIEPDLDGDAPSKEKEDEITSEAKEINFEYRPPTASWPEEGAICIKNLRMRYREDLDFVLNGLSVDIAAGSKVGIVGRTGAGKSSLLVALYRLVEPSAGSVVEIDGVDCLRLGLKDLRCSLSIIPQEPVLFSGTLRFNLDPFGERSDDEIWSVLRKCELFEFVQSKEEQLDFVVSEGGGNFSAGQKQLICIGRALLKKSRVLALDEATSSIDKHTDSLIQTLIRNEFEAITVLCIAHRLETIIDYDQIMVLDKGRIAEYGPPQQLLDDKDGIFYGMVNSGKDDRGKAPAKDQK